MNINKVIFGGNLTHDPEFKQTKTGKKLCRFSIAINKPTGEALFLNCTSWEYTAENIAKYFSKGDPILIEGGLNITKEGPSTYIDVVVDKFYFVGNKQDKN